MIALYACSKKTTTEVWKDHQSREIPVKVTEEGDTKIYDFGVIILEPDTIQVDTLEKK